MTEETLTRTDDYRKLETLANRRRKWIDTTYIKVVWKTQWERVWGAFSRSLPDEYEVQVLQRCVHSIEQCLNDYAKRGWFLANLLSHDDKLDPSEVLQGTYQKMKIKSFLQLLSGESRLARTAANYDMREVMKDPIVQNDDNKRCCAMCYHNYKELWIEDEIHTMFRCKSLKHIRAKIYDKWDIGHGVNKDYDKLFTLLENSNFGSSFKILTTLFKTNFGKTVLLEITTGVLVTRNAILREFKDKILKDKNFLDLNDDSQDGDRSDLNSEVSSLVEGGGRVLGMSLS